MVITLLLVIGAIVAVGYGIKWYLNRNKDYWDKRGVRSLKPKNGFFVSMYKLFTGQKGVLDFDVDYYEAAGKDKFGGIVEIGLPLLLLKDADLMKHILVKDFDHFVDRRKVNLASEPILNLMLTMQEGQEWKGLRSVVSPTFTTGKIRRMFENFNTCGVQLVEFIKSKPVGSPGARDIVIKEAISRYLVDVIGATAFGMETNSLKDAESMFYKMTKKASEFSMMKMFKTILMMAVPFLTKLGFRFTDSESFGFFENILKKALQQRQLSGEKRDDFLQLMIEARKGELKTDDSELDAFEKEAQLSTAEVSTKSKTNLTDDVITAQSLLFFLAGLDTTGSVLCFSPYVLALHTDIQDKLYDEVSKVMKGKDDQVDYESIVHMEYMDKFISEILRMYPPGVRIERRCTRPYQIPDTNVTLEKDVLVFVPVRAVHLDPDLYPEPHRFDPERFTPEAKAARNPYTYLPFGHGPRNCVGMRFALMEAKVALSYLVYNFVIEPCESTPVPIKLDPTLGSRPVTDLQLRFKARQRHEE